ncbi:Aldehyde/histidinol dehydrogenase [Aspergillus granulosus]|uniref:aldehyde dehydrogenase (NAD(+)) n=1 Tax=Aspergillus granulosus TaxID=176169 RepID=A0ABR4I0D2_9EURO
MSNQIRTVSPSTGEVIFEHPGTSLEQARKIAYSAKAALQPLKDISLADRKAIVLKALEIITANVELLAKELTLQMGRPIAYTAGEIDTMCLRARYLVSIADKSLQVIPGDMEREKEIRKFVKKEPVGPVLISAAWNYPYLITINALVPALLAGNSVILRPSPQTPLVGERLVSYFHEAGLPPNALQIIHCGSFDLLGEIINIPEIALVCYIGSTKGGICLREASARRILPLNLELGGNDPAYVREDAELVYTAKQIVDGAVFNSGQSCCAIERVYVHESVHDAFVKEVQRELASYKLGDPMDKSTTTGPVISHQAVAIIQSHITDALAAGAVDVTPQNRAFDTSALPSKGSFLAPVVLTGVTNKMLVMREETFGPVIPIMKVSSDEEAVELMNESEYGLTASVWTRDIARGEELGEQIDAGTVFVNRCDYPSPDLAWIGWKNSGLGCSLGPQAFDAFYRLKSFHLREAQV